MKRRDFLAVLAALPGAKLLWPKTEAPPLMNDFGVTEVGQSAATPIPLSPTQCPLVAIRNAGETDVTFSLDDTVVMRLLPGEQWVVTKVVADVFMAKGVKGSAKLEYLTGDATTFRYFKGASLL